MGKRSLIILAGFGVLLAAAYFSSTNASQEFKGSIREVAQFTYCCVEHQGPFTDMDSVIGQLMQAIQGQNILPRGPLVGVYYNAPDEVKPEELLWEVGFPVTEQATPVSPLIKKVWESKQVAVAVHVGPYEKTGGTILKLREWLVSQGYNPDGPVLERYLDMNPQQVDPANLRTEIWIPCVKS